MINNCPNELDDAYYKIKAETMRTYNLLNKDELNNIPNENGVYKLFFVDDKELPVKLNRLLRSDDSGLLYVGKSTNLRERIRMLWRTLQPYYKSNAHPFGKKYKNHICLIHAFPIDRIRIVIVLSEGNARDIEHTMLIKYIDDFGEVPPFNSSI